MPETISDSKERSAVILAKHEQVTITRSRFAPVSADPTCTCITSTRTRSTCSRASIGEGELAAPLGRA
jgi:hypothetical protein